jgi:GNAT superfamily N-acetyltransferase
VELETAGRKDLGFIQQLYEAAFPANERKPFALLKRRQRQGLSEILIIREGAEPLGFMITAEYRDMVMLDYFAIRPDGRGRGTGKKAFALLKESCEGERLFLEIERPTPDAANLTERARRKAFYLQSGMQPSGIAVRIFGTDMELMHASEPVSFEEYCALLKANVGPLYYRIIRPTREEE